MIPDLLQYTTGVLRYCFTKVRRYMSPLNTQFLTLNDIKKNEDMAFHEDMKFFSFKIDLGKQSVDIKNEIERSRIKSRIEEVLIQKDALSFSKVLLESNSENMIQCSNAKYSLISLRKIESKFEDETTQLDDDWMDLKLSVVVKIDDSKSSYYMEYVMPLQLICYIDSKENSMVIAVYFFEIKNIRCVIIYLVLISLARICENLKFFVKEFSEQPDQSIPTVLYPGKFCSKDDKTSFEKYFFSNIQIDPEKLFEYGLAPVSNELINGNSKTTKKDKSYERKRRLEKSQKHSGDLLNLHERSSVRNQTQIFAGIKEGTFM